MATWATDKKIHLNITNPLDSDVLVLSNAANFGYWLKRAKQPVILDLVDGYLGENPSFLRDFLRNIVRTIRGTSNLYWITYTRHLRNASKLAQAVIVASPEQERLLKPFNKNVHVILDDHSEIETAKLLAFNQKLSMVNPTDTPHIFWEGFGFTLKHFRFISKELDSFLNETGLGMYLVTVKDFPRWGGYIGKVQTAKLIKKFFPLAWESIKIIPWSLENLAIYAEKSQFGIIPIDPADSFARLKSENKLLSMWHLGLPVIFSDTPSYVRVATAANVQSSIVKSDSWRDSLKWIASASSERALMKHAGTAYIHSVHTRETLVAKWDAVLLAGKSL